MSLRAPQVLLTILVVAGVGPRAHGEEYAVDSAHSAAVFRVSHLGLSWTYGRFKNLSGTFTIDAFNPSAARFELVAKVETIDTDNAIRDEHLKSPDFFNAKQYPLIIFKSTTARPVDGGYEVVGHLTMHGFTKPLTIIVKGGRSVTFPGGVLQTGYVTEFTINRSDFGMNYKPEAIGDEILVGLSFEGIRR